MARRITARARRRGEEGMALMLVLLLIVMVSAAGVFAAQSTAFEIRSAGFLRQASQTHYIAQSGVTVSLDEMKNQCSAYVGVMRQRVLSGMVPIPPGLAEAPLTYNFEFSDFNNRFPPNGILVPATSAMGGSTEGSLGTNALVPGFITTTTVLAEVPTPIPGFGVGGGRDLYVPMLALQFQSNGRTTLQGITTLNVPTSGGNVTAIEQARVVAQVPCL